MFCILRSHFLDTSILSIALVTMLLHILKLVTVDAFKQEVVKVKDECSGIERVLVIAHQQCFSEHEVILQLWMWFTHILGYKYEGRMLEFSIILSVLKVTFYPLMMWVNVAILCLGTLLSAHILDLQVFFFKMKMVYNFEPVLHEAMSSTQLLGFGVKFLHLPSSTISFQNT